MKNRTVCSQLVTKISPRRLPEPAVWRENAMLFSGPMSGAARWLRCALIPCALLLLTSCASDPRVEVVTETRTVEVPVEVVRPLPQQLTAPLPYPAPLAEEITIETLIDRVFDLYDLLDQANQDRAAAKRLTTP